jgi:hypothetical protein
MSYFEKGHKETNKGGAELLLTRPPIHYVSQLVKEFSLYFGGYYKSFVADSVQLYQP